MAQTTVKPRPGALHEARLGSWVVRALPQGRGLPPGAWERRHRGLMAILLLHVVAVPSFGLAMGYGIGHAALEGLPLVACAAAAHWKRLGPRVRATVVSIGLLTASGVLVHFSGGYIEFHFHFFVMIALLSLYVDWIPFLVAVGYVAVHHGLVGVLDAESVYNHPDAVEQPWKWAGIHAAFVLAAGAANVFTWRISEEESRRRENVERVTEAALAKLPLDQLLDELLARISDAVAAEMATIWLTEGDELVLRAAHGGERPTDEVRLPLDAGFHAEVVARAEPVAASGVDPSTLLSPPYRTSGVRALAGVPLVVEGGLVGVLDVASRRPREFTEADLALLQLVGDRIGPAIDRARLYEQEHRIASTLQRSLLPKRLPEVRGVELAARYLPAGAAVAVGGDWYDAMELDDGRLVVAMGDVAGHGTEAASLMGQLRTALRAYASEGHDAATVVGRLNALLTGLEDGSMATLLLLEIDTTAAVATLVNAGHPPPLLRRPDGRVEFLTGPAAPPLGARRHAAYGGREVDVGVGSTLVLYTDGLIERRGVSLDDGFAALERRLAAAEPASAEDACRDVLVEASARGPLTDDAAVLVLRTTELPAHALTATYPAELAAVSAARRTLEQFLRAASVPEPELRDVVLACAEACSNAAHHAYGPTGGSFSLAAEVRDGAVRVTVADSGSWRRVNGTFDGGRGLQLMRALVDSVDVEPSAAGTRVTLSKTVEVLDDDRAA